LPKNIDGFGLPILKMRENTLLHMSNRFLEVFLKFKQADSDSFIMENTMEINAFQLFDNLPLNIALKYS